MHAPIAGGDALLPVGKTASASGRRPHSPSPSQRLAIVNSFGAPNSQRCRNEAGGRNGVEAPMFETRAVYRWIDMAA
jgi:hypothetical protein